MAHKSYTDSREITLNIVVVGGVGSAKFQELGFNKAQIGLCYSRFVNPPGGVGTTTFTAFVTNSSGDSHDYVSGTGPTYFNDVMLWVNETTYNISGASVDGTYQVKIWLA